MVPDETTSFNRRQLARSAMLGGASLLFASTSASAQTPAAAAHGLLDVMKFGATGDGTTDDTAALQQALNAAGKTGSGVFLPPAVYLTRELQVPAAVAMVGIPAWNYSGPGGTVLRLADDKSTCLLNLTEGRGVTLHGLALDGRDLGSSIHGIFVNRTQFAQHEDAFRIESCQVAHFTGDAANLSCVWCFSIRHCMFGHNRGDGINLRGWDGFLLDNWLSGNQRAGFAARRENASVTFTANRVEWNREENMLITGGDGYQITGNFFDRAGTVGIALRKGRQPCRQVTITGNFIKRSGRFADPQSPDSAQVYIDGTEGLTMIGNALESGRDDGNTGTWSPAYGIVYQGLKNSVITNNVLHQGALHQLILDQGQQQEGVIVKDNPGQLFTAAR